MIARFRFALLLLIFLAGSADPSQAQVTAGGAFVFASTPAAEYVPGSFSVPPGGTEIGVVAFVAAPLSARLGVQGEVSVPRHVSTTGGESHPGGTFTKTSVHRDVLVSALLRVRATPWCNLLAGAGAVFASTSATSVFVDSCPTCYPPGKVPGWTEEKALDATGLALTAGADFLSHIGGKFYALATARVHRLSRPEQLSSFDDHPVSQAGRTSYRVGFGGMVAF